jgi:hypothetical protein
MTDEDELTEPVWVIPMKGEGAERRVTTHERRELIAAGYDEVRVTCESGPRKGEHATMFLERGSRENIHGVIALEASKALVGCGSMQVFRPDGSQLLP